MIRSIGRTVPCLALVALLLGSSAALAGNYQNLRIAVYFRYQETQSIPGNLDRFATQWANLVKQVKVDKVYLETARNGQLVTEAAMTTMKKFFQDRGIKVSAGIGLTVQESNGFQSFCYSNPESRLKVKSMVEFHGPVRRRDHPGRFLLHQLQVRPVHCQQGPAHVPRPAWNRWMRFPGT